MLSQSIEPLKKMEKLEKYESLANLKMHTHQSCSDPQYKEDIWPAGASTASAFVLKYSRIKRVNQEKLWKNSEYGAVTRFVMPNFPAHGTVK